MFDQPQRAATPTPTDPPPRAQQDAQKGGSLDALLAQGNLTPQVVADYLKAHPGDRDAAIAKLHPQYGNQFVNEVLALVRPAAIAKDTDGGKADKLAPDQRSYYDTMLANDPHHADKKDQDKAYTEAASSRAVSADDQQAIAAAQQKIASMKPHRIDDGKNPDLVQLEVSFDGTGNDRATAWAESNPSKIDEMFAGKGHYEKGVATEGNALERSVEFATGAGMENRIDGAYTNLVAEINSLKTANPKAEVVLVVTGFSRGAAEARAFTNTLNKRGIPVQSSKQPDGSFSKHYDTPRVGVMVLFDTVEMSAKPGGYDMSIPANVDNVLQLTARDEKRTLFPLTHATDKARPDDDRIQEVALPGSHADIGGGHRNAYSQIPLQMAREYMENAGVHLKPQDPSAVVDPSDPSLRLHDTGGGFLGMKRPESYVTNPKQ